MKKTKAKAAAGKAEPFFRGTNFRSLAKDFDLRAIREWSRSSLILIKTTKEAFYARGKVERDRLMELAGPKDLILFSWVGEWSTDVFQVSPEQRDSYLIDVSKSKV